VYALIRIDESRFYGPLSSGLPHYNKQPKFVPNKFIEPAQVLMVTLKQKIKKPHN
jgi:hypothetical protein